MPECIPFKLPGADVTAQATADVVGKRFVGITGDILADGSLRAAHAAPGARAIGVSKYDAATGQKFGVYRGARTVVPVTAGADIAAGDPVEVGPNGQAITAAAGVAVGYAETAATSGQDARICLL
jgi:hypothetical protein